MKTTVTFEEADLVELIKLHLVKAVMPAPANKEWKVEFTKNYSSDPQEAKCDLVDLPKPSVDVAGKPEQPEVF